ncbi:MAG: hypothetical protein ABI234_16335 [Ktedonobacteraceae bacterium]
MNVARTCGLTLLVLCVLGGLVAALFSPTLAATLTLPATPAASQSTAPPNVEPALLTVGPTPTIGATTAQPTQLPSSVTMLVQDTFQRPDQSLWGQSSDGQIWSGDANTNPFFSIVNGAGQISGGPDAVQAIMHVASQDAELLVSGTVNQYNAHGTINLGGVLRWQDSQNWYKVLIDGSKLQLLKSVQGKISVLATQPFNAVGGTAYSIRFRVLGSDLFAKAWSSTQPEPAHWGLMVIDTDLRTGNSGIRVLLGDHTIIRIQTFVETNVPPAV